MTLSALLPLHEIVIGQFNLVYTPASATSRNANDRLSVSCKRNQCWRTQQCSFYRDEVSGNVGIGIGCNRKLQQVLDGSSKGFLK
jgi:hypothetical protein